MNVMKIRGGIPLRGTVRTQGAKNAALPVMAACLLLKGGTLALDNVPDLCDVSTMMELLGALGVKVSKEEDRVLLNVHASYQPLIFHSFQHRSKRSYR